MLVLALFLLTSSLVTGKVQLGSRVRAPEGWSRHEETPELSQVELSFIVALKQQNLDVLDRIYWERTTPGMWCTKNKLTYQALQSIVSG